MQFTGRTVVSLSTVSLTDLTGPEHRCVECRQTFQQGDAVVLFCQGTAELQPALVVGIDATTMSLIHLKGKEKGSCLEDFTARIIGAPPPAAGGLPGS